MKRALRAFAEAPGAYLPVPEGARSVDDDRFFACLAGDRKWCNVCRIRVGADDVDDLVAEIHAMLAEGGKAEWLVRPSATPSDLVDRLRAAGCRDPEPPFDPFFTALATEREPSAISGIDVRRIETFDECLAGVEIVIEASPPAEEWAARMRTRAQFHARWLEAVRLGTPALVVHAQETSRPILERCGFERLCVLYELASP